MLKYLPSKLPSEMLVIIMLSSQILEQDSLVNQQRPKHPCDSISCLLRLPCDTFDPSKQEYPHVYEDASISGKQVSCSTLLTLMPAASKAEAVPPVETIE